jgi:succinoglycan biosynthesis transport protein ExoP
MDQEQSPGFSDYLAALRRRRNLTFGIGVPLAIAGLVVALALPSSYRSQGLFEIEEGKLADYLPNAAGDSRSVNQLDQYVASLSEKVLVNDRLSQLALDVQPYPELRDDPGAAVAALRADVEVKMVKRKILDPVTSRDREVISGFTIGYEHRDPQTAQRIAQWLTNAYAAANREQFRQRAASAAGFFTAEAERFAGRISVLEQKLAEFKSRNAGRLPDQSNVNMDLMDRADRDLESVANQIRTLQRERVFLVQQFEQAQTGGQADNVRELEAEYARRLTQYDENHPDVVSLRRQIDAARSGGAVDGQTLQAQLEAQRTVLAASRQRYSEDHPDIKRIQRNIDSLEARIASGEGGGGTRSTARRTPISVQLQTQVNAIDTQIAGLQAQAMTLRAKLDDYERRVTTSPEVEREYQQLTRELNIAREKYNELMTRQMDAELSESAIVGGRGDEFRLMQAPAVPDKPAKPARIAIAILSLIAAALFGLTAAVVAESIDPTVRGTSDLRRILNVTPMATIPEIETADSQAVARRRVFGFSASLAGGAAVLFLAVRLLA